MRQLPIAHFALFTMGALAACHEDTSGGDADMAAVDFAVLDLRPHDLAPSGPRDLSPVFPHGCVTPAQFPASQGDGGVFGPNVRASLPSMTVFDAETELAVDPVSQHVMVAWIAVNQDGTSTIAVSTSSDNGASFPTAIALPLDKLVDMTNSQSDPVVAVDSKGNFYVAWVGFDRTMANPNPINMAFFVARSSDGGATFTLTQSSPAGEWSPNGILDKPWIAVSPLDDSLWMTWLRVDSVSSPYNLRLVRSTDGAKTWSAPMTISESAARPMYQRNLAQVAVGADGRALVTWVELQSQELGSTVNRVYVQALLGDGTLDGSNVQVTGATDSPVFDDPSLAIDGPNVYVGFVSGTPKGDWDVRVAASLDGGKTFAPSVKVNDDPTCGTHYHQQIAVDHSRNLHAIWFDNRYGAGSVMHAAARPASMSGPLVFGANTFVNDAPFRFTTSRSSTAWEGDYLGLVAAGGELYAAWTDPRIAATSRIWFARGLAP